MKDDIKDIEITVQRYVLGQLSDSESDSFEEYFLPKPELVEMVETVQKMHLGLEAADRSVPRVAIEKVKAFSIQRLIDWLSVPVPAFAVLLVALVATPLAFQSFNPQDRSNEIVMVNFSTDVTRGVEPVRLVDLSNVKGDSALMVKLKSVQYPHYRLKLIPISGEEPLWVSEPFQVSALRDHLVVVPKGVGVSKAKIEVVGIDDNTKEIKVEFCHYSEVCR